jgi:hypothetical protein
VSLAFFCFDLVDTSAVRGADLMLAWRQAYQALEHHVHLFAEGEDEGSNTLLLKFRAEGSNTFYPFRGEQGQQMLTSNTGFSWRVDAVHADGSVVKGPLWAFALGQ